MSVRTVTADSPEEIEQIKRKERIAALNDCYDKVRFNGPEILVAAGEMTAQELRSVRFVLGLKCRAIQSLIAGASK